MLIQHSLFQLNFSYFSRLLKYFSKRFNIFFLLEIILSGIFSDIQTKAGLFESLLPALELLASKLHMGEFRWQVTHLP